MPYNRLMTSVYAVEIADRDGGAGKIIRDLLEVTKNTHVVWLVLDIRTHFAYMH